MGLGLHYAVLLPYAGGLLLAASLAAHARRHPSAARLARLGFAALVAGWFIYMVPFVALDYSLAEVARNANDDLPFPIRLATSWSGGGSSLYLYATMIAAAALYVMRGGLDAPAFRASAAAVTLLVLASAALNGAFDVYEGVGGFGLNPLLKSLWIIPHPLTTFGGYALLLAGSLVLIHTRDRLRGMAVYMLGWGLLTFGIMFGAVWSYETIGWGGYWAWDPVEIAELTVWLAATAALHALGPLAPLRRPLLHLTVSSGLLAPFITRSGLSPLHSFAAADVGSAILLVGAVVYLALAARELSRLSLPERPLERLRRMSLPDASVLVAGGAIIAMAVFVYASLLAPSILVVLGRRATVPTMAEGVRFYHPVLYPLFTASLLWVPGYFNRGIGWRGFAAYLASTAAAAAAAALAVYKGVHVPQPQAPLSTNYQVAVGLAAASMALGALLVGLALPAIRGLAARRRPRPAGGARAPLAARLRDPLLKVLHAGMAAAFIGVLLSGTYAFNDYYFEDARVPMGAPVRAGPATIEVLGYDYTPHKGTIDLRSHATGPKFVAAHAWQGLGMLSIDLAQAVREALAAGDAMADNATLRLVYNLSLNPLLAENATVRLTGNATVSLVDARTGAETILAENATVTVEAIEARVEAQLTPVFNEQGALVGAWLDYTINASEVRIRVEGAGPARVKLDFHKYLLVNFTSPAAVEAPHAGVSVEVASLGVYTVGNTTARQGPNGTLVIPSAIASAVDGALTANGATIRLPYPVERGLLFLILADRGDAPVLRAVLDSSLADILADPAVLARAAGPQLGDLNLPRNAPSGLSLDITLRITYQGREEVRVERIRFEANGEAAGIHGLVTPAMIVRRGLSDLYINIQPPFVRGFFGAYHETLVYYVKHAIETLPPEQALALTALMAAGYRIAELEGIRDPNQAALLVEQTIIDLYLLAERLNESSSAIAHQGITVRVKVVPGVNLVWAGTTVMGLSGLALAALYAVQARRPRPPTAPAGAEAAPQAPRAPAPLRAPARSAETAGSPGA